MATQYAFGQIVTSGLVYAVDSADRNSYTSGSTSWRDLTPNSRTGSFPNGIGYSGSNGGVLSFSSASLQSVTGSDLGSLTNFTVETWFNLTTLPTTAGAACIVTNAYTGTPNALNFSIGLNNSPSSANIVGGFFDGAWRNTTGFAPVINTWYCTAVTYNGATVIQYLNGVSQSTLSYAGTPSSSGAGLRIARRWDTGAGVDHINGLIPIVRVYNRALSATEMLQNYNAQKSRFGLI
jgi:hypothetical protein